MSKSANVAGRPAKLTIMNTLAYVYKENGIKGLYRGVTPRIGLGIWQTICMVSFADIVKVWYVTIFYCCWSRAHSCICDTGLRASKLWLWIKYIFIA